MDPRLNDLVLNGLFRTPDGFALARRRILTMRGPETGRLTTLREARTGASMAVGVVRAMPPCGRARQDGMSVFSPQKHWASFFPAMWLGGGRGLVTGSAVCVFLGSKPPGTLFVLGDGALMWDFS